MTRKKIYNIFGGIFCVIVSLIVIFVSLRVWEMNLNTPLDFHGDSMLGLPIIKSMCENGIKGLFFCDGMGAPEISALIETPFLDLGFALEVLGLNLFVKSPMVIFYLIYILTFPFAGLTMYMLLNRLSDKVYLKVFLSVAFAITPYHFFRWMGHLTLSNYYVVPIGVYLAMLIMEDRYCGIIPKRYLDSRWKIIIMYLSCVVLGWGNVYYAFFGLICMAMALIIKMIQTKRISCLWKEAFSIYVTGFSVVISLLPKIFYTIRNGANELATARDASHTEIFALKIIQLLLPNSTNRIPFLAKLNARYSSNAILVNENSSAALGLIATIGFLVACGWVIFRIMQTAKISNQINASRMNLFSLLILVIILYSVSGGFGTIVAYYITPMIRCLNRSSIVITCLSLCALLLVMDYIEERFIKQKYTIFKIGIVGVVSMFVLYSEVTWFTTEWHKSAEEQDIILRDFFEEVENSVAENSMIYQLPFMLFPEGGSIVNMGEYQPALGYVYTDGLKWSYGAVKGRNTVGESLYIDEGMSEKFVQGIIDAGFSAVYIDTRGFEDGGEAINRFYSETLGLTPIVSEDEWLYLYVLEDGALNG